MNLYLIFEVLFTISMFANAALFVPQALKLYRLKQAKDVSFITFFGFNLIQLAMLMHAYYNHDYLLIFGMLLSLLTCGAVTVLILVYRMRT